MSVFFVFVSENIAVVVAYQCTMFYINCCTAQFQAKTVHCLIHSAVFHKCPYLGPVFIAGGLSKEVFPSIKSSSFGEGGGGVSGVLHSGVQI